MTVVIDLDALGRCVHAESLGEARQQFRLGRAFSHAAGQGLAGIVEGVLHQLALFAPVRTADGHLAAALDGECLGQQVAIFDVLVEQYQARGRAFLVELGEEAVEDFSRFHVLVVLWEVGAVAPVLSGAEEEDLHAGLAALGVDGEDIRLFHGLGVDALALLDVAQGAQAVAVDGRLLEIQLACGCFHLRGHPFTDLAALAGEEGVGFRHQARVIIMADFAGAGGGAALDLEQQAGAGAGVIDRVGARAQQEGLLQGVQRAVDRAGGGEGAEIVALAAARAAMLEDLRHLVVAGDEDIGEGLVVAQLHIVARAQLLDEVGFEQQGRRLAFRHHEFHGAGGGDHPRDAVGVAHEAGVAGDALLEVARLAHIEHLAILAEHAVDARRVGQPGDVIRDQVRADEGGVSGWRRRGVAHDPEYACAGGKLNLAARSISRSGLWISLLETPASPRPARKRGNAGPKRALWRTGP